MEKIKETFKKINPWNWIVLGFIFIKTLVFYQLMEIQIHFVLLCIVTGVLLILLLTLFRKLWLSFGVYLLITIVMFLDVTYNTYFHGYLSVTMSGSAQYLDDVQDIIMQVIQPKFFLLFLDLPIIAWAIVKENINHSEKKLGMAFAASLILISLVFGNYTGSILLKSLGNLEFFSYHLKDLGQASIGYEPKDVAEEYELVYEMEEETPLFGIAEGKNLIVIQMESLQNFVINREYEQQEITPVLNELIKQDGTLYFDHYYMQIAAGNTSDAEFATNNSLYGTATSYTYELYKENTFRGLPVLLREKGYETIAMHGYDGAFWSRDSMYPAQGFDYFIDDEGYIPSTIHGWGIIDEEFYQQSVEYLRKANQPFYSFMISLSNHTPFAMEEEISRITLLEEHKNTRFGNYINSVAYSDYAIGILIEELKKAGFYDNSVIAIYGDHFGLAECDGDNKKLLTEFLQKPYCFDSMANIPLIIHVPGQTINQTLSIAGGQMDFLPTIAYLMGFETLDTLFLGQNLLTAENGFVIQNRYAPMGTFITDDLIYFMSMDGVFENGRAWDVRTGEQLPIEGFKLLSEKSAALIQKSEQSLKENAIAGMNTSAGSERKKVSPQE